MLMRNVGTGLALAALILIGGCRSQSRYRAYQQQPVVVGSAPVAQPAPCCKTPAVAVPVPPPPPPAPFGQ